jgi:hypothetical protein
MVNHATIIFGLASSPVDMFLVYFHPLIIIIIIIIIHHRMRHGYARSFLSCISFIYHLHIATTTTFIATI